MSEDEKFLSRWSQRKLAAAKEDQNVATQDEQPVQSVESESDVAEKNADEAFDLSTLPRLEEITETTDITSFLKKGVPESLRNAALRKSWALDPAIRNYVNPAMEYAYDWNTPGGVPGTSELAIGTNIARMVSQIMGHDDSPAEPEKAALSPASEALNSQESDQENSAAQIPTPTPHADAVRMSQPNPENAVLTSNVEMETAQDDFIAPQQPVRRHGTAKPKV